MSSFAITKLFKDIYPDFLSFQKDIQDASTLAYEYIFNRYCNSNIRYDTVDAFKRMFKFTYINVIDEYRKKIEIVTKMYGFTENDFTELEKGVRNVALNNNEQNSDPLNTLVEYISNQESYKRNGEKLAKYVDFLSNLRHNYIEDFIDEFSKHFTKILGGNEYAIY